MLKSTEILAVFCLRERLRALQRILGRVQRFTIFVNDGQRAPLGTHSRHGVLLPIGMARRQSTLINMEVRVIVQVVGTWA